MYDWSCVVPQIWVVSASADPSRTTLREYGETRYHSPEGATQWPLAATARARL